MWSIRVKEGFAIADGFSGLEPAKQERILNAAFLEFTEHGYEQASTNRIVKAAGIGKGMLFYYFRSKQELFIFLTEYALNYVVTEYLNRLDENESDFIEKCKTFAQVKSEALAKAPHIFNFIASVHLKGEIPLPNELEARILEAREMTGKKLYANIDMTLFRDDIPAEKCFKLIQWSLEGYSAELTRRYSGRKLQAADMAASTAEFYEILAILRKLYYK